MCDEFTDFHAGMIDEKAQPYGYAVYFENVRHTLNLHLKKAIKRRFADQCSKFVIKVKEPPELKGLLQQPI
jgi:hypothetical protein